MLRHIVLWTLHRPEDAPAFAAELGTCKDLVPGMREFDIGMRREGLDATVDVVLVSSFDDRAALDAYVSHPHHQAVVARLATMRASRSVIDFFNEASRIDIPSGDA